MKIYSSAENSKLAEVEYDRKRFEQTRSARLRWDPFTDTAPSWIIKRNILRLLPLLPGSVIVDYGAGTCEVSEWFVLTHPVNAIAVELFKDYLQLSQVRRASRLQEEVGSLNYLQADAQELPLEDDSVDGVVAYAILHHLPDIEQAVGEIYRILKPGGICLVAEPNALNPLRRLKELRLRWKFGMVEKSFYPWELPAVFGKHGFKSRKYDPGQFRDIREGRSYVRSLVSSTKNSKLLAPVLNPLLNAHVFVMQKES